MKKTVFLSLFIVMNHSMSSMYKEHQPKSVATPSSSPTMRRNERIRKKYMLSAPYKSEETPNVLFYGTTVTTGSALLCAGCALQCPLMTGTGFALLVGGAQEWQEYDLYKRNHYIRKQ